MNFRKLAIIRSIKHDTTHELGVGSVGCAEERKDHLADHHLRKFFDLEYVAYWR